MTEKKILKFILSHIKAGTIDEVFNETTFDKANKLYILEPFGIRVSLEMLEDIKKSPAHYEQFTKQISSIEGIVTKFNIPLHKLDCNFDIGPDDLKRYIDEKYGL